MAHFDDAQRQIALLFLPGAYTHVSFWCERAFEIERDGRCRGLSTFYLDLPFELAPARWRREADFIGGREGRQQTLVAIDLDTCIIPHSHAINASGGMRDCVLQ